MEIVKIGKTKLDFLEDTLLAEVDAGIAREVNSISKYPGLCDYCTCEFKFSANDVTFKLSDDLQEMHSCIHCPQCGMEIMVRQIRNISLYKGVNAFEYETDLFYFKETNKDYVQEFLFYTLHKKEYLPLRIDKYKHMFNCVNVDPATLQIKNSKRY